MDVRYSANKTTFTAHQDAYLKMTYNKDDGLFYLNPSEWVTQTLPTKEDGFYYLQLWRMYSTTSGYMYNNPTLFKYQNGRFEETSAAAEQTLTKVQQMIGDIENGTY